MRTLRMTARLTPLVCLLVATTVNAAGGELDVPYALNWAHVAHFCDNFKSSIHMKTKRTYFGKPGSGPYTKAPHHQNPWNAKIFGISCCKTPEKKYEKFLKRYQIVQAQNQVRLNRLNWDAHHAYHHQQPNAGYVSGCDFRHVYNAGKAAKCATGCNTGCESSCGGCSSSGKVIGGDLFSIFSKNKGCKSCDTGCGECVDAAACGSCGSCDSCTTTASCNTGCSGSKGLLNKLKGSFHKGPCHCKSCRLHRAGLGFGGGAGYPGGVAPYGPYGAGVGYPGMNREDATRYIEGMQYYPPYHLMRSPRDFFMFETKYGIGR